MNVHLVVVCATQLSLEFCCALWWSILHCKHETGTNSACSEQFPIQTFFSHPLHGGCLIQGAELT